MDYRELGKSGLKVSTLCLGCWSFGGDGNSYWGVTEQADVDRQVQEALDRGVNFFDTAYGYNGGGSEISLGKALTGKRDRAIICDKTPIYPMDQLGNYTDIVAGTLKRLNTDYLDLLLIHWPRPDEQLMRDNIQAIKKVMDTGMVRAFGVSNFALKTMDICEELGMKPCVDEMAYNLMSRGIEAEVMPYCIKNNIGVMAYMPLMQGVLTGKYANYDEIPDNRKRTVHFNWRGNSALGHTSPGAEEELEILLTGMKKLSAETGYTMAELAIAWLIKKPGVSSVIAGSRNTEQLLENIKAIEISLTPDVVSALDAASEPMLQKLGPVVDIWKNLEDARVW